MNNNLLQIKIKQRLNKLASMDYDNIECWQIAEAFNKAQLEWVRRQLHGSNLFKEGDEQSKRRVDDLQILLSTQDLKGVYEKMFFESTILPANYLEFKRVSTQAKSDCCPKRSITVYQAEEADADLLITDRFSKPSFEWAETFCTLFGNKVRIYTNGEFEVVEPKLIYYRKPISVKFNGCTDPETNTLVTADVPCEFKDDIVELLIDEAASILAGDIESINQYQREQQNPERNN
jgi:hypothetical protein